MIETENKYQLTYDKYMKAVENIDIDKISAQYESLIGNVPAINLEGISQGLSIAYNVLTEQIEVITNDSKIGIYQGALKYKEFLKFAKFTLISGLSVVRSGNAAKLFFKGINYSQLAEEAVNKYNRAMLGESVNKNPMKVIRTGEISVYDADPAFVIYSMSRIDLLDAHIPVVDEVSYRVVVFLSTKLKQFNSIFEKDKSRRPEINFKTLVFKNLSEFHSFFKIILDSDFNEELWCNSKLKINNISECEKGELIKYLDSYSDFLALFNEEECLLTEIVKENIV